MITSLISALLRVAGFWYVLGLLIMFLGDPAWAEAAYERMRLLPWVEEIETSGLATAAAVQWQLVIYWTVPSFLLSLLSIAAGALVAELQFRGQRRAQKETLAPSGTYWKVKVPSYSLGRLPQATTPKLTGQPVVFADGMPKDSVTAQITVHGPVEEAVKLLTSPERRLAESLLTLLWAGRDHYAGLGHGVGLLEHTLNVVVAAAPKCTSEFRMPLLAALAHDIGKLITFQPDGKGGWVRKGLHSRESARILATLPGFQDLPEVHQRALLLAVKYDHAPSLMPELRGDREASMFAKRVISALSMADRQATAEEKDRNLDKLKPEDLLWQDFKDYLREAPIVQHGKKGVTNQVNNPATHGPYLYIYEAPWRDAAIRRLPAEVAAALDLTRRDPGKLAKYTKILVGRLRKEGVLIESAEVKGADGALRTETVSEMNPLWDVQFGLGEKPIVIRGVLVLQADALWKVLNYRLSTTSPWPPQILAANANAEGKVNQAPKANTAMPPMPDTSERITVDTSDPATMASIGIAEDGNAPRVRTRRASSGEEPTPRPKPTQSEIPGLSEPASELKPDPVPSTTKASTPAVGETPERAQGQEPNTDREALKAGMPAEAEPSVCNEGARSEEPLSGTASVALAYFQQGVATPDTAAPGPDDTRDPAEGGTPAEEPKPSALPAAGERPHLDERLPPADGLSGKPASDEPKDAPGARQTKPKERPAARTGGAASAQQSNTPTDAEKRKGIAIADAAAVARYPGLRIGDKYLTAQAPQVLEGKREAGSLYEPVRARQSASSAKAAPPTPGIADSPASAPSKAVLRRRWN